MTDRAASLLAEITAAAETIEQSTNEQNERIIKARHEGVSLRDLAAAARLSHMTIKRIIERTEEP